jgi:23S rRNA (cytosine1962-C5)-methyltransferase
MITMAPGARLTLPEIVVSRRGAERVRSGHVWVYRSDIVDSGMAGAGALVSVVEETGREQRSNSARVARSQAASPDRNVRATRTRSLGTALYSSSSEIALRLISRQRVESLEQLVRERVRAAVAYRERLVQDTNAYRVIFSEGDFLPGLIVDKYNDILSLQVLTQAMDDAEMRRPVVTELLDAFRPRAMVERADARVRKLEQLSEKQTGLIWEQDAEEQPASHSGEALHPAPGWARPHSERPSSSEPALAPKSMRTEFVMNGVRFIYDALAGQKTGAFLDQRENYAAAAQYARGEALDVFCYQGGFALHLARGCDKVTGVDSSRPALEAAEHNADLNGRDIEWIEANAFDLLRDYSDSGRKYDSIILDPPAFAKSKRELATALRGYKELNLRALKMLRPGGILVTCSCSYHVNAADFMGTVAAAALDSHRIIRVLENRGAAKDHPSVLGIPETSYLKCAILLVS